MKIKISASLLAADFTRLGAEVMALEEAGVDRLHFDVMDGHFVPNLAFGPGFLKALRPGTRLPFETHLMITPVDPYLDIFAEVGSDIILVHPESELDVDVTLGKIRSLKKKAGIVLNPSTSVDVLTNRLGQIDQVLVMTVNPGFSGQKFMPEQLPKIRQVRELIGNDRIDLAVDGGVTLENASQIIAAGANILVSGHATFKNKDLKTNINAMRCS